MLNENFKQQQQKVMLAATIQLLLSIAESSQTWFLISVHYHAGKHYFNQVLEIFIYH